MKIVRIVVFALPVLFSVLVVQGAESNRWKDLVIGQSSAEQAIGLLGKPVRDETVTFGSLKRGVRFLLGPIPEEDKMKPFRTLSYDAVEGFKSVYLGFSDGKLALIELGPAKGNRIHATDLERIYEHVVFYKEDNARYEGAIVFRGVDASLQTTVVAQLYGDMVIQLVLVNSNLLDLKERGRTNSVDKTLK